MDVILFFSFLSLYFDCSAFETPSCIWGIPHFSCVNDRWADFLLERLSSRQLYVVTWPSLSQSSGPYQYLDQEPDENSEELPFPFVKWGSGSNNCFQNVDSASCGIHFLSLVPSLMDGSHSFISFCPLSQFLPSGNMFLIRSFALLFKSARVNFCLVTKNTDNRHILW